VPDNYRYNSCGRGSSADSPAEGVQSEDNWDMMEFQAFGLAKTTNVPIASFGFHRFTGSNPTLDIRLATENLSDLG